MKKIIKFKTAVLSSWIFSKLVFILTFLLIEKKDNEKQSSGKKISFEELFSRKKNNVYVINPHHTRLFYREIEEENQQYTL